MEEFQIGDIGNDQCGEGRDCLGLAKEKTLQLQSGDQQPSSSINNVKSPQVGCDGNGSFKATNDDVNAIETIIVKDISITQVCASDENFQLHDVKDSDSLTSISNHDADMVTDVHYTELHNRDSAGTSLSQRNVSVEDLCTTSRENISCNTSFNHKKGIKRRHSQDDILIYSCDSNTRLNSPESTTIDPSESFIEIHKDREEEISQLGSRMDLSDEENTIIYLSDSVKGHFNQHDKLDDFSILSCHPRIETIQPCDSTEDIESRVIIRRPCTKISSTSIVTNSNKNSDNILNNICRSNEEPMDIEVEVYSEPAAYCCDKDLAISNSEDSMDIEPDTLPKTQSYKETPGVSIKEKSTCSESAATSVPSNQENKSSLLQTNVTPNGERNSALHTNDDTEQILIEEIDFRREECPTSLPECSTQNTCEEENVTSNSRTSDEKQDHGANFVFDNKCTGKLLHEEKHFRPTDISINEQNDDLEKNEIVEQKISEEDLRTSEPIRIKYNVKSGTFEIDDSVVSYDEEASYVPPTNSSMIPEDGSVSQLDSCEELAEDDRPNTPDSVQVIDNKRCLRSKSSLIRPSSEGSKTTTPNGVVRKTRSHGNINNYHNELHGSENTNADLYLINQPNISDTTINGDETIVQCTEPCTESESSIPDNESVKPISTLSGDDSRSGSGKIDATSDVQRQDSAILSSDSTVKGSIIEPNGYDVISLLMKLRTEDSFSVAMEVIIACLEHVRLTQPNAKIFYGMMSSVYTYIHNIIEKEAKMLGTQKSKTNKFLKILYQCQKLFNTALRSKRWRHFTKTQRNNIRFWRRQLISIINISCGNQSYHLENESNAVPRKRRRLERQTEKLVDRENLYLLRQLQNYRHEVISILSECKGELEYRETRNQVLQSDIDGLEQYLKDVRRLQREEEARLRKLGARLKVAHKRLQTRNFTDLRRKEKPMVIPVSLSSKEAKLISKITTVLNECPDGATLTTVYGFLHNSDPTLRQRDLLDILNRFPTLFRQEEPASWTNREYRWKIITCNRSA